MTDALWLASCCELWQVGLGDFLSVVGDGDGDGSALRPFDMRQDTTAGSLAPPVSSPSEADWRRAAGTAAAPRWMGAPILGAGLCWSVRGGAHEKESVMGIVIMWWYDVAEEEGGRKAWENVPCYRIVYLHTLSMQYAKQRCLCVLDLQSINLHLSPINDGHVLW